MTIMSFEKLSLNIESGKVYRREMLLPYSKAIDRDLSILTNKGVLEKLSPGLYYKPLTTRLGKLPPQDTELVECFLNDSQFLLYSWNSYNSLGLGLTQLYNKTIVYNFKRHGIFKLGNKTYDFRRPARGFPDKITPEFLIIDLLNNINELAEDIELVKNQIKTHLHRFDYNQLFLYANKYGKIATKKFMKEIKH